MVSLAACRAAVQDPGRDTGLIGLRRVESAQDWVLVARGNTLFTGQDRTGTCGRVRLRLTLGGSIQMGVPMANVTGGTRKPRLVRRAASLGVALTSAVTMLVVLVGGATASSAQINIQAIVCPILLALRAIFGHFFGLGAIFDGLLTRFGCGVPSGA